MIEIDVIHTHRVSLNLVHYPDTKGLIQGETPVSEIDLQATVELLTKRFGQIKALHLFGSRRYRTRSTRSDIDILVSIHDGSYLHPHDLRNYSLEACPCLDLFIVDGGKAVSCANSSNVRANNFDELVSRLDAICFWTRNDRFLDVDIDWKVRISDGVRFVPTVLETPSPMPSWWSQTSLQESLREIADSGLPNRPYIGSSIDDIAKFLVEVAKNAISCCKQLSPRGTGSKISINSEYDFQNLFYLAVKPWLPILAKEEVTIVYDGQNKTADFNIFNNRLIVELKHVKDANSQAQVVKTLEGLASFYERHPNVDLVLFLILAERNQVLDDSRWEADFSYISQKPQVWTRVLRNV